VPGHARRAVADDAAAHLRPHTVAADQRPAADLLATFEADRDLVALVDEVVDLAAVLQRDEVVALARPQIDAMDVGTMGLVSRVTPVHTAMRNCTRDEGRPFEVGNQVWISNHRKLLWAKATVVNVAEKPEQDSGRYD
jgi:hypothetical protein